MADDTGVEQKTVGEFVGAAHGDLAKVKTMLEAEPALLNARYAEWNESALEAASHMGRREIAEHLLAAGAPLTICCAAMLGRREAVAALLEENPALAGAVGAHGIPVLFHAALSGEPEVAELLLGHGGGDGLDHAIHAALMGGHARMVEWLLAHGAGPNAKNFDGKTPLSVALKRGHDDIAALLRQHGGTEA